MVKYAENEIFLKSISVIYYYNFKSNVRNLKFLSNFYNTFM